MTTLQPRDKAIVERLLMMEQGYVLDFSDRTFAEFFGAYVKVDIDDAQYRDFGTSKAKRMRCFLQKASPALAARALAQLLEHRQLMVDWEGKAVPLPPELKEAYLGVIKNLERGAEKSRTDSIEVFAPSETLEALVDAIERDIEAGKPAVALDRLHTYCMKKFAHLLEQRGETAGDKEPLNSRAARYFNPIRKAGRLSDTSDRILRTTVEIFERFNAVRNDRSLAHDNELLDEFEARFVFDSVVNLLRFTKALSAGRFEE